MTWAFTAMPRLAVLLFLGLSAVPAVARDLQVEVEVLHVGGLLAPRELESLLADERLNIEVTYRPTRLIEGVTARREPVMPIGSRLFAIPQQLTLTGGQIERQRRVLRFPVPEIPPGHAGYRLQQVTLVSPVAPGPGRPQPGLRVDLLSEPPKAGARETPLFLRDGTVDLGLRVRHRWSDASGPAAAAPTCHLDVHSLGQGEYRFRPRHRLAGLFGHLASDVQSDPPSRPRAGRRSLRLAEPYPDPLAGWRLSRNHLIQSEIDGQPLERLSVYAEQAGSGQCRRTLGYEALYGGGRPVMIRRSLHENECGADGASHFVSIEASWLDDGSLARYLKNTQAGSESWDAFTAVAAGQCKADTMNVAPQAGEVDALTAEVQRIRSAFLRR
jgi:hypothetical protein